MYQSYTPPIYGNRWEEFMRSERNVTPESERLDHATVKFYMERLGRGTALRVGFAKAIFDGMFYVLDPDHYDRAAKEVDGEIWAPAP